MIRHPKGWRLAVAILIRVQASDEFHTYPHQPLTLRYHLESKTPYTPASTSIAAEARRPIKQMARSLASARRDLTISEPFRGRRANLNGSATHARTKRNSSGPCTHDLHSRAVAKSTPLTSATSMRVAPRLKKPTKPPAKRENPASKRFLDAAWSGGVQCTFAIIRGYTKESVTGMQLFKKISNVRARVPNSVAA